MHYRSAPRLDLDFRVHCGNRRPSLRDVRVSNPGKTLGDEVSELSSANDSDTGS
jgi:hypothetical protein